VGYDSRDGRDYWIAQNSWEKNWGNDGFFYLLRTNGFKNDKSVNVGYLVVLIINVIFLIIPNII
jgi:hypothetical protein